MTMPVSPVVYNIFVNQQEISETPLDVSLQQEWGCHDLFTIRIEFNKSRDDIATLQLWPDNAPVEIDWGRSPDLNTWYGYVNHHTVDGNADSGSGALQITYTCIGTSKPMNTDVSKTWGQVTGTFIAKTLASKYSFRAVLSSSSWVLPYEVQANESDFSFLCRIADKIGYRFWVSGGTLYFINPAVVLTDSSKSAVPVFNLDKMPGQLDTIRQFNMNQGGNLPGATLSTRQIFGLDPASGNVFQVTASPPPNTTQLFTQSNITQYASNIYDGQMRVNAWASLSQWFMSACAELYGDNLLYPGKLVLLQGRQLPADAQGYWIVASINNLLRASTTNIGSQDRNISEVQILKNSTASVPIINGYTNINPEFTTCRLQNGTWLSTDTSIIYDGVPR